MKASFFFLWQILLLGALIPAPVRCEEFEGVPVSSQQELNRIRGGFIDKNGLDISIGIERAVFLNGVLNAVSTINLSQGETVAGARGADSALSTATQTIDLTQIGQNNGFSATAQGNLPLGLNVIQNSLDNMVIRNATVINATVTNLSLFRSIGLNNLIQGQILRSLH